MLGYVPRDACTVLARIAPIRHQKLGPPSLCTQAANWREVFEAVPRWRLGGRRRRNLRRCHVRTHSSLNLHFLHVAVGFRSDDIKLSLLVTVQNCRSRGLRFNSGKNSKNRELKIHFWAQTASSKVTRLCLTKCFDALVAPISTPLANLVPALMLVALCRASWLMMSLLCSYQYWVFHQQKLPLRWVKMEWVVGEFVDDVEM